MASTAAIDCCSCLSDERSRRSLRRQASSVASSHGPPAWIRPTRGYTKKSNATCSNLVVVVVVVGWWGVCGCVCVGGVG